MHYCIIGNGVAGTEAAFAIRSQDSSSEITVVTQAAHYMYYRPRLIEYLSGTINLENLYIYKPSVYDEKHIELLFTTNVLAIDKNKKTIQLHNGADMHYDKLCIATGAYPAIPDITGNNLNGVFTLREIEDADAILSHIDNTANKDVVVVGGGLLGLETAHSLSKRNCNVTVIEFYDRLLPKQLDNEGAVIIKQLLEQKGLQFILSESVASINTINTINTINKNEHGLTLHCTSGRIIDASTVIFSMGIKARTDLAKNAGLTVNRGIIINNYLQTSNPDIFAAGDPSEHNGICYGIWTASREQGKLAGLNMAGANNEYNGTLLSVVLKITGIDLYSAGDFTRKDCTVLSQRDTSRYVKFLYKEKTPVASIVIGDMNIIKLARNVMEGKTSIDELIALLQ